MLRNAARRLGQYGYSPAKGQSIPGPIHAERPDKFNEYFCKGVMTIADGQLIE